MIISKVTTNIFAFTIVVLFGKNVYCQQQLVFPNDCGSPENWPISWNESAEVACPPPILKLMNLAYQIAIFSGLIQLTLLLIYSISTFAHTPYLRCFGKDKHETFDVAFLGLPFDTLTSYRPGARFGPLGIRRGSQGMAGHTSYIMQSKVVLMVIMLTVDQPVSKLGPHCRLWGYSSCPSL